MISGTYLYLNQTILMVELSISNESNNISNIIRNSKSWQIGMFIGKGEIYPQGWIWMLDTRVTDNPLVSSFLTNF